MGKRLSVLRYLLLFLAVLVMVNPAQAKKKKKMKISKKGQLSRSINDAVNRSEKDHKKLRIQVDFDNDQRLEMLSEKDFEVTQASKKTKRKYKKSTLKPIDLGTPDYSYEESGEDQSGLDSLKSTVEEESTDIDFDAELREVSSLEN